MKGIAKPIVVALIQVLFVASLGGKLLYDRAHYPRVWVKTAPIDPNLPIRGRYVRASAVVDASAFPESAFTSDAERREPLPPPSPAARPIRPGVLVLDHDRLVARPAESSGSNRNLFLLWREGTHSWAQATFFDSLAFFIPDQAADPSIVRPGEELWMEVTVTPSSQLRPLRLGIRKDGVLRPIR